jgi:hypothetical protein
MSSVARTFGVKKEGVTRFVKPHSPSYAKSVNFDVLFPFSYSNQVLDISYDGNNFKSIMVDVNNVEPRSETDIAIRILSGPSLATSLGDNFKAYVRSWRSGMIDADSPIEIVVAPQVLLVQEASYDNITASGDQDGSWKISTTRPSGEDYIVGDDTNKYKTAYIFKTPLTFTTVEGGVTKYITFRTILDQE